MRRCKVGSVGLLARWLIGLPSRPERSGAFSVTERTAACPVACAAPHSAFPAQPSLADQEHPVSIALATIAGAVAEGATRAAAAFGAVTHGKHDRVSPCCCHYCATSRFAQGGGSREGWRVNCGPLCHGGVRIAAHPTEPQGPFDRRQHTPSVQRPQGRGGLSPI